MQHLCDPGSVNPEVHTSLLYKGIIKASNLFSYSDSEPDAISEWKKRDEERRRELEERRKKEEAEEIRRLREREKEEEEKKKKDKVKKRSDSDSSSSSDEGVDDHPLKKSKKPPPPPIPAPSDSDSPPPSEVTAAFQIRVSLTVNCYSHSKINSAYNFPEQKLVNHYLMCAHAEPSPEEKLQKLHTDIKFALKVDNPDIERCLLALEELEAVPVTSQILHKNAEVIATLKKIRRYKASAAVMEKASDVYNKLKLRFVGKVEVAAKPKTENKESEDNGETKNTDSTPVNGDSEQKTDDVEVEDKPKSPGQEENNDNSDR
uniref:Lens epithelium-derived growth factor integrase-binding domain-containing protein n=1 Tax=Mola mola TaxID=94237 RepID=A0A3Q3XPP7_MOLML